MFSYSKDLIEGFDDELANSIHSERTRQEQHIELIASENYASPRVLAAQGSVLTNKYAEGYPQKRYYAQLKPPTCPAISKATALNRSQ